RDLLDEAWFCEAPADERERRLVERHTLGGRSVEQATEFARTVDGANAALIEQTAHRASLRVSGVTWDVRS
ncbi:MAG: nucleoside/nucleotide kinase family protein, partial [Microbacterium gubbeenense]